MLNDLPNQMHKESTKRVFPQSITSDVVCAILAAIIICMLLFPDVLFLGAGLSQTSQFVGYRTKQKTAVFYAQPPQRRSQDAYADAGGALWQSEPAQQFLRYCLKYHESPYWNPYSGAGQLGPETLVDLKFSFQSLLIALLKGSQDAFNAVVIGSYLIALFFTYLFCSRFLQLSRLAALSSCIAFAFCGYNTATLASNTSQSYPYFPVLLCLLASYGRKPSALKLVSLVVLNAVILSATFLPTSFLMLFTAHVIGFAYVISLRKYDLRTMSCILATQFAALVFAVLGLGFLYFPIIESFFYVDAVSMYGARIFHHANHNSILSFFSNKHFWEEYCAIPPFLNVGAPHNKAILVSNSMYHFGSAASIVAACCSVLSSRLRPVSIACMSLLALGIGRIFGMPVIDQFVSAIPGFKSLGEQYWFISIACTFVIAVPLGIEAIQQTRRKIWIPAIFVGSIITAATVYLYFNYGFIQPDIEYKQHCVAIICVVTLSTLVLILLATANERTAKTASVLILALATGELLFDLMYFRYVKTDYYRNPPAVLQLLKHKSGLWRTANLNIGIVPAEQGSAFQIQQVETLNMNILPTYEAFFHRNFVNKYMPAWGRFCTFYNMLETQDKDWKPQINLQMCNLMGVRYFVVSHYWPKTKKSLEDSGCQKYFVSPVWDIYENNHAFPRAFAASSIQDSALITENGKGSARNTAFTTDAVLLKEAAEAGIPDTSRAFSSPTIDDSACTITSYHNDNVSIDTTLQQPAIVILTDNWHPNWTAKMDGNPVHVGLVDETFRGVVVPKGTHRIEMRYSPRSLTAGFASTILILSLLLLALVYRKKLDNLLLPRSRS